jgi:hypothetical protein
MKRLLALFIMLAVLGMCAPSYGYILIYKVQMYGKAANLDDDSISYGKVKAYLVLSIADEEEPPEPYLETLQISDGCDGIVDANVIFYDRYKGPKFQFIDDSASVEFQMSPESDGKCAIVGIDSDYGYQCNLVGNLKATNIGLGKKVNVPKDLVGGMLMDGPFFDLSHIFGSATVTATLDTKLTKSANTLDVDNEEEAYDAIGGVIESTLEDKGFVPLFD